MVIVFNDKGYFVAPSGKCLCSNWKYPANCTMTCCAGGHVNATPTECMIGSMSVKYTPDMSCDKKQKEMSCGDVDKCACKGKIPKACLHYQSFCGNFA